MAIGGVPGHGGDDSGENDDGVFAEINITPLTDIFLVLLIIFMVTSSVIVRDAAGAAEGLGVELPSGGAADVEATPQDLVVAVLRDGAAVLDGQELDDDTLTERLRAVAAERPGSLVVLQADEGVPHGRVVTIMQRVKDAGLTDIAIGVRDPTPSGAPR